MFEPHADSGDRSAAISHLAVLEHGRFAALLQERLVRDVELALVSANEPDRECPKPAGLSSSSTGTRPQTAKSLPS